MRIMVLILLFLQPLSSYTQETRILNPDSLQADFKILKTSLIENHPIIFSYISKQHFDGLSEKIETKIKEGITLLQFHNIISRLLSEIKCGHTYVHPLSYSTERIKHINDLPFEISIHKQSIFISKAYHKSYEKFVGKKIISINQISGEDILNLATHYISSDGYNTTFKYYKFQNNFNYYINYFLDYPDALLFEFTNESFTVNFPTHFIKDLTRESKSTFYTIKGETDIVVLKLVDFDGGKLTIKKCFKHINKIGAENLIIDLRNNEGGNGNVGSYLISFIIDSTSTYYLEKKTNQLKFREYFRSGQGVIMSNQYQMKDSVTKSYYFKVHPKKKNNFNGNVFVLINGGTFSTGAYVAAVLKHKTKSTFVGEETGGSEYAIGGGIIGELVLPYSQLRIKFPMYKWHFNTTNEQNGIGVIPDIVLDNNSAIHSTSPDAGLERVIDLIYKNKR